MANNSCMNLKDWVNERRGRSLAIANALGVSPPVVSDWVTGKKGIPIERCVAIERATQGVVSRKDMRPGTWQEIWPELAQAPANTAPQAIEAIAGQGAVHV
jgi:DNA-binding transcriptional regulator YdaS (Cro superfamily)